MTEAQFRQELKQGLGGAYLLWGAEEYLKRFYAQRAQKQTLADDDDASSWNLYNIAQKPGDTGLSELEDAMLAPPFMSMGGKVFIKYSVSPSTLTDEQTEKLKELCLSVSEEDTVLVIVAAADGFDGGNPAKNKPSAIYKKYAEFCKMVDIAEQTPAELKKWIQRRLAAEKLAIDPAAAQMLLDRCGKDMFTLSGELDKLSAYALSNSMAVVDTHTVSFVTAANEEDEAFALANALLDGDRRRALQVLHIYKQHREEPAKVMASVTKSFCDMLAVAALAEEGCDSSAVASRLKMHAYRAGLYVAAVKDRGTKRIAAALKRCREADIKLKSTRLDYIAIERFICTIPSGRRKGGR